MENLTKENFFDKLRQECPTAVNHFNEWFEKYKAANDWNALFNSNSDWQDADGKNAPAPGFYQLPFEMQNGIIARFELEMYNNKNGDGPMIADDISRSYRPQMIALFRDLQRNIDNRSITLN